MNDSNVWMPLYIGSYLKNTMHLTTAEHGGYLLLIMAYWVNGGPLKDDPMSLSAICRVPIELWEGSVTGVPTAVERSLNARLRPFFNVRDGVWSHNRIDEEIFKANRNIEQKRQAGLASANARSTAVPTAVQRPFQRRGNGAATENQRPVGVGVGVGTLERSDNGVGAGEFADETTGELISVGTKGRIFTRAHVEAIYDAYPKKTGRAAAIGMIERAIGTVAKRPEHATDAPEWLLSRVRMFAASPTGKAGQYTPNPATWFNRGQYDDDETTWSLRYGPVQDYRRNGEGMTIEERDAQTKRVIEKLEREEAEKNAKKRNL